MTTKLFRFTTPALVLFLVCLVAFGQSKKGAAGTLDKETFMNMESVSNPAISPDGKQIVFTRSWVDKVKDERVSNLWIVDVDGSRVRELTSGTWRDSQPVWSPDGKRIAFLSDRDTTNQLHVLWVDTREVAQLTHLEQAPSGINWSPDGKWIAFTAFEPDNDPILAVKLPERPRGAQWAKPAVIVNRLAWAADGRGPLPTGFTQVYTIRHWAGRPVRSRRASTVTTRPNGLRTARRFTSRRSENPTPNICAATARSIPSI